jgi:hypothetical protein
MTSFFAFESDFVNSLRCIPMVVRMKLDTCGVKLKLSHWTRLSQSERQALVSMPCETAPEAALYRESLQKLLVEKTGAPAGELPVEASPAWLDGSGVPESVREKAREFQVDLTPERWRGLTPARRFALIKLSRPGHENHNFYPALQEFDLLTKIS